MTAFEKHEFINVPVNDLIDGQITWKDYINSLSPEDLAKQRAYDRNKVKNWYDQNKEKKKEYVKEWSKQKVICVCGKEITKGYLSTHLKTSKHKTEAESKP